MGFPKNYASMSLSTAVREKANELKGNLSQSAIILKALEEYEEKHGVAERK